MTGSHVSNARHVAGSEDPEGQAEQPHVRETQHRPGGQGGPGPARAQTSRAELAGVPGCGLQGGTRGAPSTGRGKVEIPSGGNRVTAANLVVLVFLSKAADLTAVIDEKEQTLQEKTEVILQKEQEIFQLKKGEEFSPVEPSDLLPPGAPTRKWPRQEAAWSHLADSDPPNPRPRSRLCPVADAPAAE